MKLFWIYAQAAFYMIAGLNHFWQPATYYPLFPPYLVEWASELNLIAGIGECAIALGLLLDNYRRAAAIWCINMLLLFVPSHIYFIQKGDLTIGPFVISPLVAWIRLLVIHPLLIAWAWWAASIKKTTP